MNQSISLPTQLEVGQVQPRIRHRSSPRARSKHRSADTSVQVGRRSLRKICAPRGCQLHTLRNARLSPQLVEERLGVFEVGGFQAFGELGVDLREHCAGFVALALFREQSCEAGGGA